MHILIVLAALAFAAVTPYLGGPTRSDVAQMEDLTDLDEAADENERPG